MMYIFTDNCYTNCQLDTLHASNINAFKLSNCNKKLICHQKMLNMMENKLNLMLVVCTNLYRSQLIPFVVVN